jgi:hypothetical protein
VNWLPPVGLVVVIGGFWGWAWWKNRCFRATKDEVARRLEGRVDGDLAVHGRIHGRDIVFSFMRAHSAGQPDQTTAGVNLKRTVAEKREWKGAAAAERVPALKPYDCWSWRMRLTIDGNWVTVMCQGLPRDPERLMALANILSGIADRTDQGAAL